MNATLERTTAMPMLLALTPMMRLHVRATVDIPAMVLRVQTMTNVHWAQTTATLMLLVLTQTAHLLVLVITDLPGTVQHVQTMMNVP